MYSLDAGDQFVAAFNQKCEHLAKFPNIGKRYSELHPMMRGLFSIGIFFSMSRSMMAL